MGTTILAASGDDGVIGYGNGNCGYYPMFPASSPYVTAVGGMVGPESGNPEIACKFTSQTSPSSIGITTGGGFSNYYAAPAFQQPFIQSYFASIKGAAGMISITTGRWIIYSRMGKPYHLSINCVHVSSVYQLSINLFFLYSIRLSLFE